MKEPSKELQAIDAEIQKIMSMKPEDRVAYQENKARFTRTHANRLTQVLNEIGEHLSYLYYRWQDEKEYEDFSEYAESAKKMLPEDFIYTGMKKRPFKVEFTYDGFKGFFTVNSKSLAWKLTG